MVLNLTLAVADAAIMKDPTRPIVLSRIANSASKVPTASALSLSVIKLENNHKIAIINDKVYQQGHRIGQDKIIKILLDRVIFSSGKELYLFGHSVVNVSK